MAGPEVVGASAITQSDVEKFVGPKSDPAAVVIALRLVDLENLKFARRVGEIRISGRNAVAKDARRRGGDVDVEEAVDCVVRMKSEPEQALFVSLRDVWDRQKGRRRDAAGGQLQNTDLARVLLEDEDPFEIAGRCCQKDGAIQTGRDAFDRDRLRSDWIGHSRYRDDQEEE